MYDNNTAKYWFLNKDQVNSKNMFYRSSKILWVWEISRFIPLCPNNPLICLLSLLIWKMPLKVKMFIRSWWEKSIPGYLWIFHPGRKWACSKPLYKIFPHGKWCKEAKMGGANKCYQVYLITCHFSVRSSDFYTPTFFFFSLITSLFKTFPLYSEKKM